MKIDLIGGIFDFEDDRPEGFASKEEVGRNFGNGEDLGISLFRKMHNLRNPGGYSTNDPYQFRFVEEERAFRKTGGGIGNLGDIIEEHPEWFVDGKWIGPKWTDLVGKIYSGDFEYLNDMCGFGGKYEDSPVCNKFMESFKTSDFYRNHPNDPLSQKAAGKVSAYELAVKKEEEERKRLLEIKKKKCKESGGIWKGTVCTHPAPKTPTYEELTSPDAYYKVFLKYCKGTTANSSLCKKAKDFWDKTHTHTHKHLTQQKKELEKKKKACIAAGGKWQGNNTCKLNEETITYSPGGHTGAAGNTGWTWEQLHIRPTKKMCKSYEISPYTYNTGNPNGKLCSSLYALNKDELKELANFLGPDFSGKSRSHFMNFANRYIRIDTDVFPFKIVLKSLGKIGKLALENYNFRSFMNELKDYLIVDPDAPPQDWKVVKCHVINLKSSSSNFNPICELAYNAVSEAFKKGTIPKSSFTNFTNPFFSVYPGEALVQNQETSYIQSQSAPPASFIPSPPKQDWSSVFFVGGALLALGISVYTLRKKEVI